MLIISPWARAEITLTFFLLFFITTIDRILVGWKREIAFRAFTHNFNETTIIRISTTVYLCWSSVGPFPLFDAVAPPSLRLLSWLARVANTLPLLLLHELRFTLHRNGRIKHTNVRNERQYTGHYFIRTLTRAWNVSFPRPLVNLRVEIAIETLVNYFF